MRHRYIGCGVVHGSDKISDFRLVSKCTKYLGSSLIRVNIPDDLSLCHYPGDSYSTAIFDNRTLDELGWDCIFIYKGEWRKCNALKEYEPHEWWQVLQWIYGLYCCDGDIYYTDDYEYYRDWWLDGLSDKKPVENEYEITYPRYKDKSELNLSINLRKYPFDLNMSYEWCRKYKELLDKQNA